MAWTVWQNGNPKISRKTRSSSLNNSRGAAATIAIILLPTLAILLLLLGIWALTLTAKSGSLHQCRLELLNAQKQMQEKIQTLLRLNPEAQALHIRRERAELEFLEALAVGNPPLIAAARARLLIVKGLQIRLRLRQKLLLLSPRFIRQRSQQQISEKARKATRINQIQVQTTPFQLAVEPVNPQSDSPTYRLQEPFRWQQEVKASLKFDISELFPVWIKQLFPSPLPILAECAATLNNQEDPWIPELQKARP